MALVQRELYLSRRVLVACLSLGPQLALETLTKGKDLAQGVQKESVAMASLTLHEIELLICINFVTFGAEILKTLQSMVTGVVLGCLVVLAELHGLRRFVESSIELLLSIHPRVHCSLIRYENEGFGGDRSGCGYSSGLRI